MSVKLRGFSCFLEGGGGEKRRLLMRAPLSHVWSCKTAGMRSCSSLCCSSSVRLVCKMRASALGSVNFSVFNDSIRVLSVLIIVSEFCLLRSAALCCV